MTTRERLTVHEMIEARNEARIKAYMRAASVHTALEIHAKAIIDSLDILAERYRLPRAELLESLIDTLYVTDQFMAQQQAAYRMKDDAAFVHALLGNLNAGY